MSVRGALRFTTLATAVSFILSMVGVVVISRLLRPEEVGIFSVAVSLIAYTHILREFGVGQYLVQLKVITREHLRAAFTIMLLVSWSIAGALLIVRFPLARFYSNDGVSDIIGVLAVNFVILPFASPILSVLKREMKFGRLAIVNVANSVVQLAVTVAAALAGESYMSMAWGSIAGNILNVVVLSLLRMEFALLLPTFTRLRSVLSFGSKASGSALVGELNNSGPDLILGKTLGFEAVAVYSRAASVVGMVLGKIQEIVGQVLFPAFAQALRNGQSAATTYCDAMRLVTGVTVPLTGVLAVLSPPLILYMFGPQWQEASRLAFFLCLFQLVRLPTAFAASALMAGGHPGTVLRAESISQLVHLLVLLSSIWLELHVVVYLLFIARIANYAAFSFALMAHYRITPAALWRAVLPSYLLLPASLAGPVAVLALCHYGHWQLTIFWQLTLSAILATVGYVVMLRMSGHPVRDELVRLAPPLFPILGRDRSGMKLKG